MQRRRLARFGLAVVLGAACRPATQTTTTAPPPVALPVMTAPVKVAPPPAVARATSPVQLLPETAHIAVSVASVNHLLRVIDYKALIGKYRAQYDQIVAVVEQSAGHNLLDPAKWREVGVDPDGPIGMAMFDLEGMAGCFFFTLSDPGRFREYVDRVGAKIGSSGLLPVYEDRGVVLATEAGATTALVLRDGFAFFVFVDRPAQARYDHARELASMDPARGLTAGARWKQAVGAGPARDVLGFFDVAQMLRADREARRKREESPEPTWAETELQRLREQGAPAEDIAKWEQIAAEQRTAEASMRARRQREQEFVEKLFGPLGPLVLELSLSDKAVEGSLRARAPEDAVVRKVVASRDAPPLAVTASGERVVFAVAASVEPAEALQALDAALKADGESLDRVLEKMQRELGVDGRTAAGAFDGTGSFALTLKDAAALFTGKGSRGVGFNLALGLRAPAEAQALLEVAIGKLPKELRPVRKGRGVTVSVPDWREVHVAVVGKSLAISTDPEFQRRVERGAAGAPARALPAATVPVVMSRQAVGVFFMDYLAPMGMWLSRRSSDFRYEPSQNQPYWRFPEVAHEKIDRVPQSAAYKAKMKSWTAADDKVRKAEEVRERAQMKVMTAVAESIGSLAVSLRETGDGLQIDGGHYFGPGGLAQAIELGIEAASSSSRGGDDPVYKLYEERSRVEQEMQEIRVRDIERALGVQAPSQ